VLLLDTHAFLWWCADDPRLSSKAKKRMTSEPCFVSIASLWEMAIKISLEKLTLPEPLERWVPNQMQANGFSMLEIGWRHVARSSRLPWHYRDPFDRLLIAQALEEGFDFVSADGLVRRYGVKRIW
jgi:PIN domain nuclease of toxin-antitoxin system